MKKTTQYGNSLTGNKYGTFTVKGLSHREPNKKGVLVDVWLIKCKCGEIQTRKKGSLTRGHPYCGKSQCRETKLGRPRINTIGKIYGKLTIIDVIPKYQTLKYSRKTGLYNLFDQECYKVECDCGKTSIKTRQQLSYKHPNCGSLVHLYGQWYPDTPNLLPDECLNFIKKYEYLVFRPWSKTSDGKDGLRYEALIRSSWITYYKKCLGKNYTDIQTKDYLYKTMKYVTDRLNRDRIEDIKYIGNQVTNSTLNLEPLLETMVNNLHEKRDIHKIKFKRC